MSRVPSIFDRWAARSRKLRLLAVLMLPPSGLHAEPVRAAVFGFEFLDTSQEGEAFGRRTDEAARVRAASDELLRLLAAGGVAPVDLAPAKARIDKAGPLTKCKGCDADSAPHRRRSRRTWGRRRRGVRRRAGPSPTSPNRPAASRGNAR